MEFQSQLQCAIGATEIIIILDAKACKFVDIFIIRCFIYFLSLEFLTHML